MGKGKLKISVIIPTYNRPEELRRCIRSILAQTVRPDEIIVVDDGDLDESTLRKECEREGIKWIYRKKERPGVVTSRNLGIEIASGDIIFFLEDDVVLFPDYIEKILWVYKNYNDYHSLGGVGGIVANPPKRPHGWLLLRLFSIVFLISGFREGKVLPSGFGTDYGTTGSPIKKIQEVDFLPGGVSSFKREVLKDFRFSEKYQADSGYGQGEDRDFSYRVSRRYKLLINPEARLYHYPAPKTKHNKKAKGRAVALFHYLFFKDHLSERWWRWPLFIWAFTGYLLMRVIIMFISMKKEELERVKGLLTAVRDILTGRKITHI